MENALVGLAVMAWLAAGWPRDTDRWESMVYGRFGAIPVCEQGRVKPLDSVARNALLRLRGRQTLRLENGAELDAVRWLAEVLFSADAANRRPLFAVRSRELLALVGKRRGAVCSYDDLEPFLGRIDALGRRAAKVEPGRRSAAEEAVVNLREAVIVYRELPRTLGMVPCAEDGAWLSLGESFSRMAEINPMVRAYAAMGDAFRAGDSRRFSREAETALALLERMSPGCVARADVEVRLNRFAPFFRGAQLYLFGFVLACGAWLWRVPELRRSALVVLALAFALHTAGLAARMYLLGRPPVTNLYSSAVFLGWGAVAAGLMVERVARDGAALVCGAAVGCATLVIAHHFAAGGETLELLQAVLASNLWLAAHVVTITLGFAVTFLAGTLAALFVVRDATMGAAGREALLSRERLLDGVLWHAALLCAAGTLLGGFWAERAWGRFWGWDPKENAALLVVLWCAAVTHARRAGMLKMRGLLMCALFGNIVTAYAWLGVDLFGAGLHAYGKRGNVLPWIALWTMVHAALLAMAGSAAREEEVAVRAGLEKSYLLR